MRVCPGCRTCYEENINVCPKDGLPLIDRAPTFALIDGKQVRPPRDKAGTKIRPGLMIGEYKVEKVLAEGGMGVIYAGIHPLISKRVAIKVLNKRFAQDPKAVSRFVLEARSVNEIGHHNIVDIFSIGELDDGRNYLIMELLEGMPLHEILMKVRRLKPGEVLPVYEQICDALSGAHSKGFVHRDLKPDNIVVLKRPPYPFIKILDFGLAKLRGSATSTNTEVGTVLGTPEYMAPEQCRGKNVDARTDVYALGVMLYELLTGRRPFTDPSPLRVLAMQQRNAPKPPSKLAPISEGLERLILTAMAKDPAQRFASVHELLSQLDRVVSERLPWAPLLHSSWNEHRPVAAPPAHEAQAGNLPMAGPPDPQDVVIPSPVAISDEVIDVPAPEQIPISGDLIDDDSETLVSDENAQGSEHPDAVLQKIRETLTEPPSPVGDTGPAMPSVRNVRLAPAEARAPAPFLGTPGSDELEDMGATEVTDPAEEAEMLAAALKASSDALPALDDQIPEVIEPPTNVDPARPSHAKPPAAAGPKASSSHTPQVNPAAAAGPVPAALPLAKNPPRRKPVAARPATAPRPAPLSRTPGTNPFPPPMKRATGQLAAAAGGRPAHGPSKPAAAPKPPPSFDLDVDVDVVPQEEMTPPPRTESAEMLVDLPPEELKGQRPQNQAKPKSGVYDVTPVGAVAEETSQPEVVAELTQKKQAEDEIGMAKTLPAVEMTDEERAKLRAKVRAARANEASEPDLVFEAAAPDESKPVIDLVRPGKTTQPGTKPLSEMLAGEPKSAWYTNTWVIVTMAVVAAAAIAGTVLLVTCSG